MKWPKLFFALLRIIKADHDELVVVRIPASCFHTLAGTPELRSRARAFRIL